MSEADIQERFKVMRVVHVNHLGAFLDQNQEKDLFLPQSEQTRDVRVGDEVVVALYEDREGRPCSSMRIERFLDKDTSQLKREQRVDILVYAQTDLGFKAAINERYSGLLYRNEVFQKIRIGDRLKAFVKEVRPDGKVDLILQAFGNKGADDIAVRIIEALEDHNGFLEITDKTDPEIIYNMFGVSKKKFKIALGGLYKKRLISVTDKGIKLV